MDQVRYRIVCTCGVTAPKSPDKHASFERKEFMVNSPEEVHAAIIGFISGWKGGQKQDGTPYENFTLATDNETYARVEIHEPVKGANCVIHMIHLLQVVPLRDLGSKQGEDEFQGLMDSQ